MKYDIVMLGHVSKDVLVDHLGAETRLLGGAVVQSSAAAARAGARVLVVTKASASDAPSLSFMKDAGADLLILPSGATTSILNVFRTPDHERRDTSLLSRADPFSAEDFPDSAAASIIDLAGLFVGELPDRLIADLKPRGRIAVDAQGLLRRANDSGAMLFSDWQEKRRYLPLVDFFKADAAEAEILTGFSDREKAARTIAGWGAGEVMVTHNTEVLVLAGGVLHRAPFTPANLSGRTGRGDTTFASYLARRDADGPERATRFAAALCSIKMESPGPFKGTVADVEARMERDRGR